MSASGILRKVKGMGVAFDGKVVKVERDLVVNNAGTEMVWEVVKTPNAAAVVPFVTGDPEKISWQDEILMVHQFRYAPGHFFIEAPAGLIEDGEDAEETAKREMGQEVGYESDDLRYLGTFYAAPGALTQRVACFRAYNLKPVERKLDDAELGLEIVRMNLNNAYDMLIDGGISDMKTALIISRLWNDRSK